MIRESLIQIKQELPPDVKLVAVSKYHPLEAILEAYEAGQRFFAESRPQEFLKKIETLRAMQMPTNDIEWHFIGHLQTNKLKMVLPYAHLVQSVDSRHLLDAINKWGQSAGKYTNVLLELHIGAEESKQGFVEEEVLDIMFNAQRYPFVRFCGLMGMATYTDCTEDIEADFERINDFMAYLRDLFPEISSFREVSIGMSGDWPIAIKYGATMVRIGSAIFGNRV